MKYIVWYEYYTLGGHDIGLPKEFDSEDEAADYAVQLQNWDDYSVQGVSIVDGESVTNIKRD